MKRGLFGFLWLSVCLLGAVLIWAATADPATADPATAEDDPDADRQAPVAYDWDTDNLLFGGFSSASFRIPSHDYASYGYSHEGCAAGGVADGFFQTRDGVNDFPVLVYGGGLWGVKVWGAGDKPCDGFVRAQERMKSEIAVNGGYYLDSNGNLQQDGGFASRLSSRPSSLTYGQFTAKGTEFSGEWLYSLTAGGKFYFCETTSSHPRAGFRVVVSAGSSYARRLDIVASNALGGIDWAIYPSSASLVVFWGNQSGKAVGSRVFDTCPDSNTAASASPSSRLPFNVDANSTLSRFISHTQSALLCPAGFHPRGEDSQQRIGNTTGRTLSSLTHAEGMVADKYWCRSDFRFKRKMFPYTRPGVTLHSQAQSMSATNAFYGYGRINCYYTSHSTPHTASGTTGIKAIDSNAFSCNYPHPLPQCDPDPDNGSDTDWRALTETEITAKNIAVGTAFNVAPGDDCTASTPATPPQQAGFSDDPCVTATIAIYENRPAGSDASPGVLASDRTLAVSASRPAHNLSVTSPHPLTASPPRDQTTGTGDPTGCADGSENRSDHTTTSAGTARKQNPAPAFTASVRTDTSAPPNDADGDISYTGAVRNLAHRFASRVAENTCAVKRAEAEAELALLEAREAGFSQWLADYKTAADGYVTAAGSYRRARAFGPGPNNAFASALRQVRGTRLVSHSEPRVRVTENSYLQSAISADLGRTGCPAGSVPFGGGTCVTKTVPAKTVRGLVGLGMR